MRTNQKRDWNRSNIMRNSITEYVTLSWLRGQKSVITMQYHFQGTHCSGKIIIMETNLNIFFAKNKWSEQLLTKTFRKSPIFVAKIWKMMQKYGKCCKNMENVANIWKMLQRMCLDLRYLLFIRGSGPGHTNREEKHLHSLLATLANHPAQYIANHLAQCKCQLHS